jgi:GR25 family glycosyltransferase involved in LPS biosynthesis
MNRRNRKLKLIQTWGNFRNKLLRTITRNRCEAFGVNNKKSALKQIEKIYVINLDRQPKRLTRIKKELSTVTNSLKKPLTTMLHRVTAVDALNENEDSSTSEVKSQYTLQEQLFVDPCQALPQELNLDMEIEMSRQEIAVACSHIKAWKEIVSGDEEYSLVLEDDICLHPNFASLMEKCWIELSQKPTSDNNFDILFLSFKEVDMGAEKVKFTRSTFKLFRGIWFMSGYVLSKKGAEKLLSLLPVVGPVDLWINHKFDILVAIMNNKSIIPQRSDETSGNFYSIIPVLSKIGVLNDGSPSYFDTKVLNKPIFATGKAGNKLTSLAMSLSMLGYRCCSDVEELPDRERINLFKNKEERIFDAYVNVGCLEGKWEQLFKLYPNAQIIVFKEDYSDKDLEDLKLTWEKQALILSEENSYQWKSICEFLKVVPPVSSYPKIKGVPRRNVTELNYSDGNNRWLTADKSPWVIERQNERFEYNQIPHFGDRKSVWNLQLDNSKFWLHRDDTFPGNECLFSPANLEIENGGIAKFMARKENMEVRNYSSSAITSRQSFLYGKFEAELKPPKVSGLVTGIFLHRDSPRQEIDIEFVGNKPTKMLTNVFYNPGVDGARFDYGYRGTPYEIELGFDASKEFHKFSIEWSANEIKWFVDDKLVHKRSNWGPTPIPHLPMQFHVNLWPTRSRELAGKIDISRLPAVMLLRDVSISVGESNPEDNVVVDGNCEKAKKLGLESA